MISLLVFVQVKCKTVVKPNSFWQVIAKSKDFSLVEPPAPQVTVMKRGFNASIRWSRAKRLRNPVSVFGGKNSKDMKRSCGPRLLIFWTTDIAEVVFGALLLVLQ